ncbi:hypothetical protein D9M72_427220 [compost metagenome]
MRDVAARIPEGFRVLPGHQVGGDALGDDAAAPFRSGGVPGRQQHPPSACALIPEYEGIPPVPGLEAVGRAEGEFGMFGPGLHSVGARCVHDQLEGRTVRSQVAWVLPRVEQVVDAGFIDDDAARVGIEVEVVLGSVLQGNAVVLELGEVLGGDEVP